MRHHDAIDRAMEQALKLGDFIDYNAAWSFITELKEAVRGQITDAPDSFEQMPRLIIDGKSISWEELGRMLDTNPGFRFKLEILDRSEEK
jgi:hypothetical protein